MGSLSTKLIYMNNMPYWHHSDGTFQMAKTDERGRLVENALYLKVGDRREAVLING